jgi:molybdenum cofactor cytidylyltransferase
MRSPGVIILAAGGSKRMGRPKQLLPWGKSTLLRHACEIALSTTCRPIIVVLGCNAAACRRELDNLPIVTVINDDWQKGLGSSIAKGIKALESEAPEIPGAMLLLADQPTVTPALLLSLIVNWSPPAYPLAATAYGDNGGVPAIFDRTFFPELRGLEKDQGARAILAREKIRTASVDPGNDLIDLDTLANYCAHQP